jgi:hypothetical protein
MCRTMYYPSRIQVHLPKQRMMKSNQNVVLPKKRCFFVELVSLIMNYKCYLIMSCCLNLCFYVFLDFFIELWYRYYCPLSFSILKCLIFLFDDKTYMRLSLRHRQNHKYQFSTSSYADLFYCIGLYLKTFRNLLKHMEMHLQIHRLNFLFCIWT